MESLDGQKVTRLDRKTANRPLGLEVASSIQNIMADLDDKPLSAFEQASFDHVLDLIYSPGNQSLYSHELLQKVLAILNLRIPEDLTDIKAAVTYMRKQPLTREQLRKLTAYMGSSPVLIERSLTIQELEALGTISPAFYNKRGKLQRGKKILADCDKVTFTLFTDGQELITLEKMNRKYVLREFETSNSFDEIENRFREPIPSVPKTTVLRGEDVDDNNYNVLALTEKIAGDASSPAEIIDVSRKLADSIGFVVELNDQNFIRDEAGHTLYVDGDLIDYLINSPTLSANENDWEALEKEIAGYKSSAKRMPKAA